MLGTRSNLGEFRLLLEELCCDLCRFEHTLHDGLAPEAVRIGREYWLSAGAFADIRVAPQPPYFVEVKYGYCSTRARRSTVPKDSTHSADHQSVPTTTIRSTRSCCGTSDSGGSNSSAAPAVRRRATSFPRALQGCCRVAGGSLLVSELCPRHERCGSGARALRSSRWRLETSAASEPGSWPERDPITLTRPRPGSDEVPCVRE